MARIKHLATALLLAAAPAAAIAQDNDATRGQDTGRTATTRTQDPGAQNRQDRAVTELNRQRPGTLPGQARQPGQAGQPGQGLSDRLFVDAATESGQAEIAVSQLALQRAQSDEVKQFARRMIDDHTRANQELMQRGRNIRGGAPGAGVGTERHPPGAPGTGALDRTGTDDAIRRTGAEANRDPGGAATTGAPGNQDQPGGAAAADPSRRQVRTEAGAGAQGTGRPGAALGAPGAAAGQPGVAARGGMGGQCPTMQAEYQILASKSGAEFDRAYIKQQVAAHMCAVSLFEAASQSAQDDQLRQFAAQTLPTLREHLQMAKSLMHDEEQPAGIRPGGIRGDQTERPGAQPRTGDVNRPASDRQDRE